MKIPAIAERQVTTAVVVSIVVMGVIYLLKEAASKAAELAKQTATAVISGINPADPDNVANRATLGVGSFLTGDPYFSLGGWVQEATHPNQPRADAPTRKNGDMFGSVTSGASSTAPVINPSSEAPFPY